MQNTSSRSTLLITGVARSGTTALMRLLNSHPRICLGNERYRWLFEKAFVRDEEVVVDESLFSPGRFFDYRPEDSNQAKQVAERTREPDSREFREKFKRARLVGDKLPNAVHDYARLMETLPRATILFLVREVAEVAASWNARAHQKKDWPASNDYRRAVEEHNIQYQAVLDARQVAPERLLIARYDRLFLGSYDGVSRLLQALGCPDAQHCHNWFDKQVGRLAEIQERRLQLSPVEIERVKEDVDEDLTARVRALAL